MLGDELCVGTIGLDTRNTSVSCPRENIQLVQILTLVLCVLPSRPLLPGPA